MKQIFICWLTLLLAQYTYSQNSFTKKLNIGDYFPNVGIGSFRDNPEKEIFLSQYKNKLVILDFWNIHCHACIKSMPEMDSLQKAFGDQIQIILVTQNTADEVKKLFTKTKVKDPELPMIVNDKILNEYFPHQGDPLHVWIDGHGQIQFITFGDNASKENIKSYLSGKKLRLPERASITNEGHSLAQDAKGELSKNILFSSVLIQGYHELVDWRSDTEPNDSLHEFIRVRNVTAVQLYDYFFSEKLYGGILSKNKRVLLEIKNKEGLYAPANAAAWNEWSEHNLFSYELVIPKQEAAVKYDLMLDDLNRYFPFEAKIEERKIQCWMLRKLNSAQLSVANDSTCKIIYGTNETTITNISASELTRELVRVYQSIDSVPVIVNCDTISGRFNLHLECSIADYVNLKRQLYQNGFELSPGEKEIEVLVISDKKIIN